MAHKPYSLTPEELSGLYDALDKTRVNGTTVTVNKDALRHILVDHAEYAAIRKD